MTFSRDVVGVFLLAGAFNSLQALRLPQSAQKLMPDFIHAELVSKYGIMFSMDVFPYLPSSDTKLSSEHFTSITLQRWSDEDEISKHLAMRPQQHINDEQDMSKPISFAKKKVNVAPDLLKHSRKPGTTSIHHSMYIDAINTKTGEYATVYVISSALPAFIASVMPKVNRAFVLISGDSILKTPGQLFNNDEDMQKFINNPLVLHWFAQNGHSDHVKFTRIPNGLDYHTLALKTPEGGHHTWGPHMSPLQQEDMLKQIRDNAIKFTDRKSQILVGFSFNNPERKVVAKHLEKSQMSYVPGKGDREHYWKDIASTKYVASPLGAGWDCHRTWETLALGSVPIVGSSGIDKLFLDNKLPVSIITDWAEVEHLKESQLAEKFGERNQDVLPAMTLQYWVAKIRSKARL